MVKYRNAYRILWQNVQERFPFLELGVKYENNIKMPLKDGDVWILFLWL
jgi:hypothetical protein